ncbi:hypothetical protein SCOR_32760 [Sulfidibacter corallicola]
MTEVFSKDEITLIQNHKDWSKEKILASEGVFFFKDIVKPLGLSPAKVKHRAKAIKARGGNAWEEMGLRLIWNHWVVRMTVFSSYYREHLISKVRRVDPTWDGNDLLKQKGLFQLSDVCSRVPFTSHQLRYQAKTTQDARNEIGVFKDPELNTYLVDMEIFAPWIIKLWQSTE